MQYENMSKRWNKRCTSTVIALMALLSLACSTARAGSYTYTNSLREIHCGILLLDSAHQTDATANGQNTPPDIIAPYPFYILEKRLDIKPAGWHISNPLAPKTVTQRMLSDYPNSGYILNDQVASNMLVYWQVSLPDAASHYANLLTASTNPSGVTGAPTGGDDLAQFDVLLIHTHGLIGLTHDERICLRNYVDRGGTLWIEDSEGATTATGTTPPLPEGLFADVKFNDDTSGTNNSGFAAIPSAAARHPLIMTPYPLSGTELNNLGDKGVAQYFMTSMLGGTNPPDPSMLFSVIGNSGNLDLNSIPLPYVAAGDYGSGHIIIDNADISDAISNPVNTGGAPAFCETNYSQAAAQNLKFLVNLIAWSTNTSASQQSNPRHTGFQNVPIYSAVAKSWLYPGAIPALPANYSLSSAGIAVLGNVVYAATNDTATIGGAPNGVLRAFDLIPSEDLDLNGNPDDGWQYTSNGGTLTDIKDPWTNLGMLSDYSQGLTYDQLWYASPGADGNGNTTATLISAPTVAYIAGSPSPSPSVCVENSSGVVTLYEASAKPVQNSVASNGSLYPWLALAPNVVTAKFAPNVVPPSPTYYRGWLVAEEPDNTVMLRYNLNGLFSGAYKITVDGGNDTSGWVGSPVIAAIPSTDSQFQGTDTVAYVSTQQATYALFLGSRDEQLQVDSGGRATTGSTKVQNIQKVGGISVTNIVNAPEDKLSAVYTSDQLTETTPDTWPDPGFITASPDSSSPSFDLSTVPTNGAWGDYDIALDTNTPTDISRQYYNSTLDGYTKRGTVVGSAVGPDNNLYVTVNEQDAGGVDTGYIEAIHDQNANLASSITQILWRFALVTMPSSLSGDNISYDFSGYRFVGSPVIDGSHVYALVQNPVIPVTNPEQYTTRLLCFNLNPQFQIDLKNSIDTQHAVQLSQSTELESSMINTNGPWPTMLTFGQYSIVDAGSGVIKLNNFAATAQPNNFGFTPNIGVPMPLNATYSALDTTGSGAITGSNASTIAPISTSGTGQPLLEWWVQIPNADNIEGALTKIGDYLYCGGYQNTPTNGILVSANTLTALQNVNPTTREVLFTTIGKETLVECGAVDSPVVASGIDAVFTGSGGVEGSEYSQTVVADSNRLVALDPSGDAVWSFDTTKASGYVGDTGYDTEYIPNGTTANPYPGATPVTTQIPLNRPASVSEFLPNDYLMADSGNNRCVRTDRSGTVLWELTQFTDPNGLLQAGAPLTLNHPQYVTAWRENRQDTSSPAKNYVVDHYLICDTGNSRIIEVDDQFVLQAGATTGLTPVAGATHYLVWASHTLDRFQRSYRYIAGFPYTDANNNNFIVAGVANKQIAQLITNGNTNSVTLDNASRDSQGSSILFLNYTPGTLTLGSSAVTYPASPSTQMQTDGNPALVVNQVEVPAASGNGTTLIPLNNLRYLSIYAPQGVVGATTQDERIMVCDDDGVFDGIFNSSATAPYKTVIQTVSTTNGNFTSSIGKYASLAFQLTDYNNLVATPYGYPLDLFTPTSAVHLQNGNYLITNGASVGNAQGDVSATNFGGCVFEISIDSAGHAALASTPLARPTNTSYLSEPSFAFRSE